MSADGSGPADGASGAVTTPEQGRPPWESRAPVPSEPAGAVNDPTVQTGPLPQVFPGWTANRPPAGPVEPGWEELERGLHELPPPRSMPLRQVRGVALLALAIVLVCTGLGGVAWLLVPAEYAGRVELLYPISVEQPTGFLREDRSLTTQVVLIGSRAVVEPVAAARGIPVEDLQRRLVVEVVESSEIIRVEARAGDRAEAVRIAAEVTDRYLAISTGEREAPARDYVSGELTETRQLLAEDPNDPGLLERERALVAQLDSLTTADLARPVPSLLVPPFSVPDPVGPGAAAALGTGALVGVLVAAPIVLVRARRRRR